MEHNRHPVAYDCTPAVANVASGRIAKPSPYVGPEGTGRTAWLVATPAFARLRIVLGMDNPIGPWVRAGGIVSGFARPLPHEAMSQMRDLLAAIGPTADSEHTVMLVQRQGRRVNVASSSPGGIAVTDTWLVAINDDGTRCACLWVPGMSLSDAEAAEREAEDRATDADV